MVKESRKSIKSQKRIKRGVSRKLNAYFKEMLKAKRLRSSSFMYKGKKYVGRSHSRLGMIYKKA